MSASIEQYIQQAAESFSSLGREERAYLDRLSASIEDYFSAAEPASPEAISQVFGVPQSAAGKYAAQVAASAVTERTRTGRFVRACSLVLAGLCLLAVLAAAVHFGLDMKRQRELVETPIPVYSDSGEVLYYERYDPQTGDYETVDVNAVVE